MVGKKRKPQPVEDPDQSRRFIELAEDLEAAGDLNPTAGEAEMDRLTRKAKDWASDENAEDS
ncbi:MAG: hypothetical protein IT546_12180 [Caulobacteraceae bacterium]|nr:hypothetical protein [Caulobacteraceae bacterium]